MSSRFSQFFNSTDASIWNYDNLSTKWCIKHLPLLNLNNTTPFSTGQLSAFIIQLVTWQVLPRSEWKVQGRTRVKYLIGRSFSLHLATWNSEVYFIIFHQNGEDAKRNMWCCINFPAYKTFSPVDIRYFRGKSRGCIESSQIFEF